MCKKVAGGELPDSLPGFNLKQGVERLAGATAAYRRFIVNFGRNHRNTGAELRCALQESDLARAGQLAHALRGVAANLAATSLHTAAGDLESACTRNSAAEAEQIFLLVEERLAEALAGACSLDEPQPEPVTTGVAPDTSEVLILVREMMDMARQYDLRTLPLGRELTARLAGTGYAALAQDITQNVDRMDFPTAIRRLEELVPLLEGSL